MQLSTHPLNLTIRFLLEIFVIVSVGLWGWKAGEGWVKYLYAFLFPSIIVTIWGVFNVPGDPSRSGNAPIRVSGIIRLMLEFSVFGLGFLATVHMEYLLTGIIFGLFVIGHYAFSIDRIKWLLSR